MCVQLRRVYRGELRPKRVADFVGAALLSVLSPADWQVTADVEMVAAHYAGKLAQRPGDDTVTVQVTVHSTHVEVVLDATDPGWVTEQVRIRPRRPFAATFACELPDARRPLPPRPVLWPALGRPREDASWAETWDALHTITQGLQHDHDTLGATLTAVAAGVHRATTFTLAVVNVVEDDGVRVVAVAGSDEARETMLGEVEPLATWEALIADATTWGSLRYAAHDAAPAYLEGMVSWTPEGPAPDDPDAWHPDDVLFAPLYSSDDTLLGTLSVDLPPGAPRPGRTDLERLEVFAEHAAAAIERSLAQRGS